jgi:hypothetical protein
VGSGIRIKQGSLGKARAVWLAGLSVRLSGLTGPLSRHSGRHRHAGATANRRPTRQQRRRALSYHDHRGASLSARDLGHHRSIHHTQSLHTMNPQLVVHHAAAITSPAHLRRQSREEEGQGGVSRCKQWVAWKEQQGHS